MPISMLTLLLSGLTAAVPPAPLSVPTTSVVAVRDAKSNKIKIDEYKLPNGLRVILSQDKSAPVIAINVTYDVGSRNEKPGRTGFAHLFEHMMFQGSENVGKGEHILLTNSVGGSMNGTTNQDRTNYFETLPSNQLKLGLFLEADRMRSLDVSQANLDNQRAVVQEERRQSYDNRAYGQMMETMLDLAYSNFAYKHSTIGSMKDLDAATLEDVKSFFSTYYAPNNAVLSVVGDFDAKQAKQWISEYFGSIPSKPAPPKVDVSEPNLFKAGERRKTLTDKLARQTQIIQGFITVPGDDKDYYALIVLGDILYSGRTSRLYKSLIEPGIAVATGAGPTESRGPGLFTLFAQLPPGKTGTANTGAIEKIFDDEVARIVKDGVTQEEVKRVITANRVAQAGAYRTALSRATALSLYAVYFNDPNRVNDLADRIAKVTPKQVQEVAKKYLTKENRSVVIIEPVQPTP